MALCAHARSELDERYKPAVPNQNPRASGETRALIIIGQKHRTGRAIEPFRDRDADHDVDIGITDHDARGATITPHWG